MVFVWRIAALIIMCVAFTHHTATWTPLSECLTRSTTVNLCVVPDNGIVYTLSIITCLAGHHKVWQSDAFTKFFSVFCGVLSWEAWQGLNAISNLNRIVLDKLLKNVTSRSWKGCIKVRCRVTHPKIWVHQWPVSWLLKTKVMSSVVKVGLVRCSSPTCGWLLAAHQCWISDDL